MIPVGGRGGGGRPWRTWARRWRTEWSWGPSAWWGRARYLTRIRRWRPAAPEAEAGAPSVHVLTGEAQADLALWALATWTLASGGRSRVWIHDDGSLRPATRSRLEAVWGPGSVQPPVDPAALARTHPRLADLRRRLVLGAKLVETAAAAGERLVVLDTDVLCFAPAAGFQAWAEGRDGVRTWFNEDEAHAFTVDPDVAQRNLGVGPPPFFNSGLVWTERSVLAPDGLEEILGRVAVWRWPEWWVEQTVFALAAARAGDWSALPGAYAVGRRPGGEVARHYVAGVRGRYFSEGLGRAVRSWGIR